jgi:transcriptional regulator with XRE-family HTH domain
MRPDIAANVRAEMARRGKSQADIGSLLGITRQAISRRLLGHVAFDADDLATIATYLNVSVAVFFDAEQASA